MNRAMNRLLSAAVLLSVTGGSALSLLVPATAHAALERVGPTDPANGYPKWYQDTTGLALEFCSPRNAAERDGAYCLLLPADVPVVPEVFPGNFFDEHFYWAASATGNWTYLGDSDRATLTLALEGAFSTGVVVPGAQIVFGRLRIDVRNLPLSGTYKVYTPYGEREFPNQVAGDRLFVTEDIGIGCPPGDFSCALSSAIGPLLLPSNTSGGAELPPFTDAAIPGGKYVADPARVGKVTGSPIAGTYATSGGARNPNIFRLEGPGGVLLFETFDFRLMGRIYGGVIPNKVVTNRANYASRLSGIHNVDVCATGEPTKPGRLPGSAPTTPVQPILQFHSAPCGGTTAPFTAPAGSAVAMSRSGNVYLGWSQPDPLPASLCIADTNASDLNGLVPVYYPATLSDQVYITDAVYDSSTATLSVRANSSDDVNPPTLSLEKFGALVANVAFVNGQAQVTSDAAPVAVRVLSSKGGAAEAQVTRGRRAATGVTLTASPAGPSALGTAVTFSASGSGSSEYQYRFLRNNGGGWAEVQAFGPSSTYAYTAPAAGTYSVSVDVRTSSIVDADVRGPSVSHTAIDLTAPATGVTVTPTPAGPATTGTPVVFKALGTGGTGTYQYRFYLDFGDGAGIVQDWSTTDTWTLPASMIPGNYYVYVWVRTSSLSALDFSSAAIGYVINPAPASPATGLTVTPSPVDSATTGTPVAFKALGIGGTPTYQYRFYLNSGAGAVMVQDWSTTDTWNLPASTVPGRYSVYVWVRTSSLSSIDFSSPAIPYLINPAPALPATGLIVTASPTSPGPAPVTFQAAGQGGTPPYQYRFYLDFGAGTGMVQDWSATDTWTLPVSAIPGAYNVYVWVRTSPNVALDLSSPAISYTVQ